MIRIVALFSILLFCAGSLSAQMRTTFAYGDDPAQTIDAYLLSGSIKAPAIVMLHGGAWRFGDKRNAGVWQEKARYWRPQGFAFFSVGTRLLPEADPITQAQDLATAIAFVQQNALLFGIDAERMIVMGHSAGAHVAALVATDQAMQRRAGASPWRGTVVLDTAAIDLVVLMQENPSRLYRRAFGDDPAYWQAASPLTHLDDNDQPFLIVCAAERARPCPAAQVFASAAQAAGVPVTVAPQSLSHRQINTTLGTAGSYTQLVDAWIADQLN